MLPLAVIPAAIQAPPAVDMSPFTGQASDAALGRLPLRSVPQTVQPAKPDERGNQQQRKNIPENPAAAVPTKPGDFSALVSPGRGELLFPSSFSTSFIAQLFGQLPDTPEQMGIASIWLGKGKAGVLQDQNTSFYERIQEFDQVKYAPSGAKPLISGTNAMMQEWRAQNAQALVYRRPANRQDTASLFTGGVNAYSSAQSRALSLASTKAQEVSVTL